MSFDEVRELAKELPGVEESAGRGAPSIRVRGKLMACPAIHKSAEPDSLVVKIGLDDRAELIAADPEVYYVTEHYLKYSSVLVRLARIDRESLRSLLGMAWKFVSDGSTTIREGGIRRAPEGTPPLVRPGRWNRRKR